MFTVAHSFYEYATPSKNTLSPRLGIDRQLKSCNCVSYKILMMLLYGKYLSSYSIRGASVCWVYSNYFGYAYFTLMANNIFWQPSNNREFLSIVLRDIVLHYLKLLLRFPAYLTKRKKWDQKLRKCIYRKHSSRYKHDPNINISDRRPKQFKFSPERSSPIFHKREILDYLRKLVNICKEEIDNCYRFALI